MVRRLFEFMLFLLLCICSLSFYASAECDHNFCSTEENDNYVCFPGGFHSCYCTEGCGSFGTVSGGAGAKEKCSFSFAFEKSATCLEEGKQLLVCTVCYNRTEIITPKTDHSYKRVRKLPTCTEGGYDLYTCTVCEKSYKENVCNAFEHISDGGVVETLPSFDNNGIIVSSCRICGKELGRRVLSRFTKIDAEKMVPDKVKNFKVKSANTTSVKLGWDKSSTADKYKIYYSSDKKTWKYVTATRTYITVKNLTSAKRYYFKTTAVGKDGESEESDVITAYTRPAKAVIVSAVSSKKTTAILYWKKLNNVSGYEISYTSKSFDKEKSVKKITVGKSIKKTVKKLKSGEKYRFRIRSYKNFGSKKIYGAYSKVKILKIK